jgi:Flp pilus assembly protein TadB
MDTGFLITLLCIGGVLVAFGLAVWALVRSSRRNKERMLQRIEDNKPENIKNRLISQGMSESEAETEANRQSQDYTNKLSKNARTLSIIGLIFGSVVIVWGLVINSSSSTNWMPILLGVFIIISSISGLLQTKRSPKQ